jgi:hypothetical protein
MAAAAMAQNPLRALDGGNDAALGAVGTIIGDIFGVVGPASLKSWFDGKKKSAFTLAVAVFHTLSTLAFFAFAVWMLWYYTNHDAAQCSRLFMYILVTSIVLLVYIAAGLLCGGSSNAILALFHIYCCFSCVFLFLNIWSIFGGVWVFSDAGNYYPVTCDPKLVSFLQVFLIFYWTFVVILGVSMGIYAFVRIQEMSAHPELVADAIAAQAAQSDGAPPSSEERAPLQGDHQYSAVRVSDE